LIEKGISNVGPVLLTYFACAIAVVVIYLRLYLISVENGTEFGMFVDLVHPVMQVAMFVSVFDVADPLGQILDIIGVVLFALATFPFALNILFQLGKRGGQWKPKLLKWFDLGESVTDSVIHAVLCVGMAHMFLPHSIQSEWLNKMLTLLYVVFFFIYALKLAEQLVFTNKPVMRFLAYWVLNGARSRYVFNQPDWPLVMKIVAHIIMFVTMIVHPWVHNIPNMHIH